MYLFVYLEDDELVQKEGGVAQDIVWGVCHRFIVHTSPSHATVPTKTQDIAGGDEFLTMVRAGTSTSFRSILGSVVKRRRAPQVRSPSKINPAACYSPTQLPTQYHRRWRA